MTLDTTMPNGIRVITEEPARGEYGWVAHITIAGHAEFHFPGVNDPAEIQRRIHEAAQAKFDR
jgi:hypothetical protein